MSLALLSGPLVPTRVAFVGVQFQGLLCVSLTESINAYVAGSYVYDVLLYLRTLSLSSMGRDENCIGKLMKSPLFSLGRARRTATARKKMFS